jgi:outer membrane protein assembly factor BamA
MFFSGQVPRIFPVLRRCLTTAAFVATCALNCVPSLARADPRRALSAFSDEQAISPPSLRRQELGIVPLVGGDSDVGLTVGLIGSYAQFAPEAEPYVLRTEVSGMLSSKYGPQGITNPYQDAYATLTLPTLLHSRVRLSLRAAYTAYHHLLYYGLGNASRPPAASGAADGSARFTQYRLAYPQALLHVNIKLVERISLGVGAAYIRYGLTVLPNSKLAQDLQTLGAQVHARTTTDLWMLQLGLQYDSRDTTVAPSRGMQHTLSARIAPGLGRISPSAFSGFNLSLRQFVPLHGRRVVLAARAVGDILVGNPPVFVLAQSADGYALGGGRGVRGLPAQRYYGKTKVYGNLEVRVRVARLTAFEQPVQLGLVAFADGGRLWATLPGAHPDLDGRGAGLKYGVGGGLRVQWGTTFLLRGDVAWSPDATPVACYFNVGHVF